MRLLLRFPSRIVGVVFAASCLVTSSVTWTARADNVADAEEMFRRAKSMMATNRYVEACPLLKESYRLDPAQGTLLNLALCNEQIGKIGTAWGQFRAVEQQARRATPPRTDRVDVAKAHADKLEPRLSRVRLVVPPAAKVPGLVLKVDGEEKGEPLWATGIVVDPGVRTVEASAPKKKPATVSVRIEGEGGIQTVELRPLDDVPEDPKPNKGGASTDDALVIERARAQKTTGYIVGGIGLASLAAGAAFGIAALINDKDAKKCSPCVVGSSDAAASNDATDRALTFSNVANVTLPIGAIGAAVGALLIFTAGPTEKVALLPSVSPRSASLDLVWRAW